MRRVSTSMTRPSAMSVNASPSKPFKPASSFVSARPEPHRGFGALSRCRRIEAGGGCPASAGACGAARNHYR